MEERRPAEEAEEAMQRPWVSLMRRRRWTSATTTEGEERPKVSMGGRAHSDLCDACWRWRDRGGGEACCGGATGSLGGDAADDDEEDGDAATVGLAHATTTVDWRCSTLQRRRSGLKRRREEELAAIFATLAGDGATEKEKKLAAVGRRATGRLRSGLRWGGWREWDKRAEGGCGENGKKIVKKFGHKSVEGNKN